MVVICMQIRSKVNHVAPSAPPVCLTQLHQNPPSASTHTHIYVHYLPSKSLWRDESVLSNLQLYINESKNINITLIIILFFFKSRHEKAGLAEKGDRQIQAKWRGKGQISCSLSLLRMCWGCAYWGEVLSVGFVVKEHHARGSWHIAHFFCVCVF